MPMVPFLGPSEGAALPEKGSSNVSRQRRDGRLLAMLDLILVILAFVLFAATGLYARAAEWL